MTGGGTSQQPVQTQTATRDPWSGAQPFLLQAMNTAAGLQDAGTTASYNPYSGQVNADVYPWLQQGQMMDYNVANDPLLSGEEGNAAGQQFGLGMINNQGMTDATRGVVTGTMGIGQGGIGQTGLGTEPLLSGNNESTRDYLNSIYNNIIQNTPEQVQNYRNTISQMQDQNPWVGQVENQVGDQIASRMSGAGRYGSGKFDQAIAAGIAPVMEQDYQDRQNRILQANQGLGQVFAQQGQAAQGMLGVDQADLNARVADTQAKLSGLGASADIYNSGLNRVGQWAQLDPSLAAANYAPGQQMQQLGGFYQQRSQADLNRDINVYNALQAYPWESLSRFNAIVGGAGGLGGSTVGTSTTSVPLTQRLLGGALVGGGLGSAFGPIGTGLGAVGGGLAGGFL